MSSLNTLFCMALECNLPFNTTGFLHTIPHSITNSNISNRLQLTKYPDLFVPIFGPAHASPQTRRVQCLTVPVFFLQTYAVNPFDGLTPWGGVREGTLRASTFSCSTWRSPPAKQAPSAFEDSGRANSISTTETSTQSSLHLCFGLWKDRYIFW